MPHYVLEHGCPTDLGFSRRVPRSIASPDAYRANKAQERPATANNGTGFHSYLEIERQARLEVHSATPYRSSDDGTNENTNSLIAITCQSDGRWRCSELADRLNTRPRKRYDPCNADRTARGPS